MLSPTALMTKPFLIEISLHNEPVLKLLGNLDRFNLSLVSSIAPINPFILASPTIGWSPNDNHLSLK